MKSWGKVRVIRGPHLNEPAVFALLHLRFAELLEQPAKAFRRAGYSELPHVAFTQTAQDLFKRALCIDQAQDVDFIKASPGGVHANCGKGPVLD